jgi:hypothetical protein
MMFAASICQTTSDEEASCRDRADDLAFPESLNDATFFLADALDYPYAATRRCSILGEGAHP